MNTANLKKTRDYLAEHPASYSQHAWMHPCGTPACVAGMAVVACGGRLVPEYSDVGEAYLASSDTRTLVPDLAQQLLGLSIDESECMFVADPYPSTRRAPPTSDEALAMLDWAIEHNEVRWPLRKTGEYQA